MFAGIFAIAPDFWWHSLGFAHTASVASATIAATIPSADAATLSPSPPPPPSPPSPPSSPPPPPGVLSETAVAPCDADAPGECPWLARAPLRRRAYVVVARELMESRNCFTHILVATHAHTATRCKTRTLFTLLHSCAASGCAHIAPRLDLLIHFAPSPTLRSDS